MLHTGPGSIASFVYNVRESGVDKTVSQVSTVEGAATFGGRSVTRVAVRETVKSAGVPDLLFEGANYLSWNDAALLLSGTTASVQQNGSSVVQTLTLTPPLPDVDFGLTVGSSSQTASSTGVSFAPAAAAASSFATSVKLTFVGFETVTVPAGTFVDACKFSQDLMTATQRTTVRWIARGSGVMLRSVSGSTTQELASATLDGVTVTPATTARSLAAARQRRGIPSR